MTQRDRSMETPGSVQTLVRGLTVLEVLNGMDRARVVQSTDDYVHVEFRSAVFGFVDDVEFYFSPPGIIQVRSASRTGYYDFGVNRERVESLRARLAASGL